MALTSSSGGAPDAVSDGRSKASGNAAKPASESAPDHGYEALEEDLVERARRGDVAAFESLYRRHVGRIHSLCRRMCGNGEEAEEMVQEAFVRAWQKLESFRGESAFGSWLHRLAVNVVLGSWRAAGRYRERVVAVEAPEETADARADPPPIAGGYPSATALAIDLERAIATLPTGARTVFVLHDVEGWPHRDIAERMGMAEGTSKTQLHRARQLLRAALAGSGSTGSSSRPRNP